MCKLMSYFQTKCNSCCLSRHDVWAHPCGIPTNCTYGRHSKFFYLKIFTVVQSRQHGLHQGRQVWFNIFSCAVKQRENKNKDILGIV